MSAVERELLEAFKRAAPMLRAGPYHEYVEEGGEYAEEGGVEEITLESVGMLMGMIAGEDEEARDEALAIMCELLGNCYGEDGMAVGQTVREAGGPAKISWLLESSSLELQRQALFLCSNLASDAVDPMSRETKLALLQCGTEYRLLPCLNSEDEGVLIYTCATVQNLCHELAWSRTMIRHGVQKRLEELCEHESELVVRYSAGALKNIMSTLATEERAEMSRNAAKAVETRAKEVALELFTDRRAVRLMQRAARQFLQLMCAPPLHRRLSTAAPLPPKNPLSAWRIAPAAWATGRTAGGNANPPLERNQRVTKIPSRDRVPNWLALRGFPVKYLSCSPPRALLFTWQGFGQTLGIDLER